ncbi:hypothetical protein DFH29DRAFT_815945, partial [Suillus ampliporus]
LNMLFTNSRTEDKIELNEEIIQQSHKVLQPFTLKRLKKDVKSHPDKVEKVIKVRAAESAWRQLYRTVVTAAGGSAPQR